MRSFRICIIGALSFVASIFLLPLPSYAFTPTDPDFGVRVIKNVEATIDAMKAVKAIVVAPADLAFVAQIHNPGGHLITAMATLPLKPEYAESYQTHGLIFLKPPLRC